MSNVLAEKMLHLKAHLTVDDPLSMSNSENPNTQLTQALFDGSNFVTWSRQLRRALGAKMKIGFLTGTIARPSEDSADLPRWIRCDEMVVCWILGSMVPELSNSFILTNSARELWVEIVDRYSQGSTPMLFQLKQELMRIVQGNLSVTAYFNKLKRCWDELQCLKAIPTCECGFLAKCTCKVLSRVLELEDQDKLLHFLVNLNSDYDAVKSQIIAMEPTPTLNSSYLQVLRVEKQKNLNITVLEPATFQAGTQQYGGVSMGKKEDRKSGGKERRHCNVCNQDGHNFDACFEVIGYPDWYKGKRKGKGPKLAANVTQESNMQSTPLASDEHSGTRKYSNIDPDFVQAMCVEMMKVFKGKSPMPSSSVNFAGPFE